MKKNFVLLQVILSLLIATSGQAQDDWANVDVETVKVTDSIFMLKGGGGNVTVSVGEDGVIVIDDQFAPMTDRIIAAIRDITDQPVRFIINTHFHADHTGGNEGMHGKTGGIIVAHENVRSRLSADQFVKIYRQPASPAEALPIVTFDSNIRFHMNDDEIDVVHLTPHAHTDGDSAIFFRNANVLVGGDMIFFGLYPFVDMRNGGSVSGYVEALDKMIGQIDEETHVIPGHGSLGDLKQLRTLRDLLLTLIDRVKKLVDQGKTRDEVIAAKPSAEFDQLYDGGSIKADEIIGYLYDGLAANQ